MPGSSSESADRISSLLTRVLETPLQEQPGFLEELCVQHPDCAHALREGYGSLQQLDLVQVAHVGAGDAAPPPGPAHGSLPRSLGPFRLLELLGAGGMGAVYRAEDTELKRMVALKLIRSELFASERTRTRFQRESAALARLDHPGLCTAYRAGATDGQPWIAMRLVRGTTLAGHIASRRAAAADASPTARDRRSSSHTRREVHRVVLWFEKIARALATAHAVGVVHRDLKPGNIVLATDDEPVVIDFGLVHLDDSESHLTISGDQIGTPAYMAPEQVQGEGHDVAPTTDVYALGVTMFEALTGVLPYAAKSREELFTCITRGRRLRLRQAAKDLPADLEFVLEKALEPEPERRYASMSEFAEDLRRFRVHEPLLAAPPSGWYRLRKLVRRYPGPIAAAGAVFATAVVGAVVALQFALGEQAKVREFDLLSGVVLREQAIAAESELHPPWPHKLPAMERWLEHDIGRLLAIKPEIDRTVQELGARALPPTEAESTADRHSHPELQSWERATKRTASLRWAHDVRTGRRQLVVPELSDQTLASTARELGKIAWDRIAPKFEIRTAHGEEIGGLALARAAVAKGAATHDEFHYLDTLAWALLANGQDAEARTSCAAAVAKAPEEHKESMLRSQRELEDAITRAPSILAAAEAELARLTAKVNERRTYRLADPSSQFLHRALSQLSRQIESVVDNEKGRVEQRQTWARQIRESSLAHPHAAHTWAEVRAAVAKADDIVASRLYANQPIELRDEDVLGLVPIGMNPVTRLWEFYELRSAWNGVQDPREIAIPCHDASGRIDVREETGIVFVLLPGGTFLMGAQRDDARAPNFDPQARVNETPHEVTLAPFLLARHEMTQGQWSRLWNGDAAGREPSLWRAGTRNGNEETTFANPVNQVTWTSCESLLRQHGCQLPTEAQWEYACRAGTSTPYTCEHEDLAYFANLADEKAKKAGAPWNCEAWDDGWMIDAPVGSFEANAFGLHDVHGNVWEWCRDELADYYGPVRSGDGLRLQGDGVSRCFRGGGSNDLAVRARSAWRSANRPSIPQGNIGLRAARSLHPLQ
ncbi:MAG TPA: bifunctional serine/threonine-protein kinase/formylglycine-generating enzyme family protein [Planctomycetota bacterium]